MVLKQLANVQRKDGGGRSSRAEVGRALNGAKETLTALDLDVAQLPVHGEVLQVHGAGGGDGEPATTAVA